MKFTFDSDEEKEDFLKMQVENAGLSRVMTAALLDNGIRTVGGICSRSPRELKRLLGLSNQQVDMLSERLSVAAAEAVGRYRAALDKIAEESVRESFDEPLPAPRTAAFSPSEERDIVGTLAEYFGSTRETIESHTRQQDAVRVRDMIVYLLREHGGMSYPAIGQLLGGRDHTTIIHAYRKMHRLLEERPETKAGLAAVISKVKEIKERKLKLQEDLLSDIESLARTGRYEPEPQLNFKEIPERNAKILELYREGLTLQNIANVFDISRERVRQVVIGTVKQMAVNESVEKGIAMDTEVLMEEESKKRRASQEAKANANRPKPPEKRWSKYYPACRSCGTTALPHVRRGLCEKCAGQYRSERREEIITRHGNRCGNCDIAREEAVHKYGRDFYITKDQRVLCRGCFLVDTGTKLGHRPRGSK